MSSDPHRGPVPDAAWLADAEARQRGRVQMFNASRPGGLDGWTMALQQYDLMRGHILRTIDEHGGIAALRTVVELAQDRYASHPAFPGGRTRNYCTFTKVDLEARCEIERVTERGGQRIRRYSSN